jgi:hypothetical protein
MIWLIESQAEEAERPSSEVEAKTEKQATHVTTRGRNRETSDTRYHPTHENAKEQSAVHPTLTTIVNILKTSLNKTLNIKFR